MAVRIKEARAQYDVIVVGGGVTGMTAAMAAARHGARTALIQDRSVFGGNGSSEIRMHICGASCHDEKKDAEETGILYEIMLENKAVNDTYNYAIWDRVLFDAVKGEKNLTVYLNTVMTDADVSGARIQAVRCYQSTTEMHYTLSAPVFADCTGNGTLGFMAGAEYRLGSEGREEFHEPHAPEHPNDDRMGNTLLFKAIDRGAPVRFVKPANAYTFTEEQLRYRKHADLVVPEAQKAAETLLDQVDENTRQMVADKYCLDYGYWWIELPGSAADIISEYEDIRDELVKCVYGVWDHIKNGGDHGAANYDLAWVGMLPGVRESRRLVGDYLLNENDVLENRLFPDAVAYGGWPVDNHVRRGLMDFDKIPSEIYSFPGLYTIPYRCYYSKNIENLFIGGRALSATKLAMASSRVMGTCAVGGQAIGTAAALCARCGCDPRAVNARIGELQQTLLKDDCYIPGVKNEDARDLLRTARVTASSEQKGMEAQNALSGVSRREGAASNLWASDGMAEAGETLTCKLSAPKAVREVRLTFDPNLSLGIKISLSSARCAEQRVGVPPELVKDYTVTLFLNGEPVARRQIVDNHQRLNVLPFPPTLCDELRVCVTKTNGADDARIFEIRAYE